MSPCHLSSPHPTVASIHFATTTIHPRTEAAAATSSIATSAPLQAATITTTTTLATALALTTHFSQTSSSMAAKAEAAVARFFVTNLHRLCTPSSSPCHCLCLPHET